MSKPEKYAAYLCSFDVLSLKETRQIFTKGQKQCLDFVLLQFTKKKPNNKKDITAEEIEQLRRVAVDVKEYMKARDIGSRNFAYNELAETHYKLSQQKAGGQKGGYVFAEAAEEEKTRAIVEALQSDIAETERKAEETENTEERKKLLEEAKRTRKRAEEIKNPSTVRTLAGRSKKGCFEFVLTKDFAETLLKNSRVSLYPLGALSLKSALAFDIITKLAEYYNKNLMNATKHGQKISVKSLLSACPSVPTKEDLNIKGKRHYKQLIAKPVLRELDNIKNTGELYFYTFLNSSGQSIELSENGNWSFDDFANVYLVFKLGNDYPKARIFKSLKKKQQKHAAKNQSKNSKKGV